MEELLDVVFESNNFAGLSMTESALSFLTGISDGDCRTALNSLQSAVEGFKTLDKYVITKEDIKSSLKKTHFLYDRKGEAIWRGTIF